MIFGTKTIFRSNTQLGEVLGFNYDVIWPFVWEPENHECHDRNLKISHKRCEDCSQPALHASSATQLLVIKARTLDGVFSGTAERA